MKPLPLHAFTVVALCTLGGAAVAQDSDVAPAPPAVPIGEVGEEPISPAVGQKIEGMATVIDGDELRVGDSLIRLFGIAAPDISSNFGPDARVYLDGLVGGQHVVCTEVDRNEDNESVAICTIDGTDVAPELLSQGLAAIYRVGAPPTPEERELAARYDSEEADARSRKLGIWAPRNVAPPAPPAPPPPDLIQTAIPRWIEHAPLLGLIALLGIGALIVQARRRNGAAEYEVDEQLLAATLRAEVSAIRDSAQEQYETTASLIQDLPVPGSHHGLLSLPGDTVFAASTAKHAAPDLMAFTELGAVAANVLARAVARGVYEAKALPFPGAQPAWKDKFGA